jgi:hypothetical protein
MSNKDQQRIRTLGLFEKRFDGDNCLMDLARHRFMKSGMGAEMHADTNENLDWTMSYRPSEAAAVVVHLPRDFNLLEIQSRARILEFSTRYAGRVDGFVLHDHPTMATRKKEYIDAAWEMDGQLEKIRGCPMLFIEYAAGVDPNDFAGFFEAIPDLDHISTCIDIGHVGIRAARAGYAKTHAGEDICALKSQPARLPQVMPEVEAAVTSAPAVVLDLVERISTLKKPVHFHLHDGHPLSTFSPFGVSDHLSFLSEIPIGFEYRGARAVAPMFGSSGLEALVSKAVSHLGSRRLSFTLEIHPTGERLPLGNAASLFGHWADRTNAEKMNHWLMLLDQNHLLLQKALQAAAMPKTDTAITGLDSQACVI